MLVAKHQHPEPASETTNCGNSQRLSFFKFNTTGPFFSVGAGCYTSDMLNRAGLRQSAGPFDWVFSSPALVRECLNDQFATYLNRAFYQPVAVPSRGNPKYGRTDHAVFRERHARVNFFNHHDVTSPEGYAYINRAVLRFLDALKPGPWWRRKREPTLVLTEWDHSWDAEREFREMLTALERNRMRARVVAVSMVHVFTLDDPPEVRAVERRGGNALYRMKPKNYWHADRFEKAEDEAAVVALLGKQRSLR